MRAAALPGGGYAVWLSGDVIDVVPGVPVPEGAGNGPAARLWEFGDQTRLQLGAQWPVEEKWLRSHARNLFAAGPLTGSATRIQVAVTGTPTLSLIAAGPAGRDPVTVGVVDTSGYPPFTAVVNLLLDADGAAAARAAADGERGRLLLTITGTLAADLPLVADVLAQTALHLHPPARGTQASATADLADWFHPPAGGPTEAPPRSAITPPPERNTPC